MTTISLFFSAISPFCISNNTMNNAPSKKSFTKKTHIILIQLNSRVCYLLFFSCFLVEHWNFESRGRTHDRVRHLRIRCMRNSFTLCLIVMVMEFPSSGSLVSFSFFLRCQSEKSDKMKCKLCFVFRLSVNSNSHSDCNWFYVRNRILHNGIVQTLISKCELSWKSSQGRRKPS